MFPCTSQAWVSPWRPGSHNVSAREAELRLVRLARWLLCGLVIAAGCSTVKHQTEHAQVTGQVTYNGKPVTGGRVLFVAVEGGWAGEGIIDKNGNYTVSSPVGDVKIAIDNMMLTSLGTGKGTKHEIGMKGAGKPRPDAPEAKIPEGTYMKLPSKYSKLESSGLTYTVKKGDQTYNIQLTD
jgi:hypothetical protein